MLGIERPADMEVKSGCNQDKPVHLASRQTYYDELAMPLATTPHQGTTALGNSIDAETHC